MYRCNAIIAITRRNEVEPLVVATTGCPDLHFGAIGGRSAIYIQRFSTANSGYQIAAAAWWPMSTVGKRRHWRSIVPPGCHWPFHCLVIERLTAVAGKDLIGTIGNGIGYKRIAGKGQWAVFRG